MADLLSLLMNAPWEAYFPLSIIIIVIYTEYYDQSIL